MTKKKTTKTTKINIENTKVSKFLSLKEKKKIKKNQIKSNDNKTKTNRKTFMQTQYEAQGHTDREHPPSPLNANIFAFSIWQI